MALDAGPGSAAVPDDSELTGEIENLLPYLSIPFASPEYWNSRYSADPSHFEWYLPYSAFRGSVARYFPKNAAALDVGCGTSSLCRSLLEDGFSTAVGVDRSPVAIAAATRRAAAGGSAECFVVGDCTALTFQSKTFDIVFDKGMYDSIVAGPNSWRAANQAVAEVARVLKPNGIYVQVTHGSAKTRNFAQFFRQVAVEAFSPYSVFVFQKPKKA
jgi:ubiquinone/menaquinone biosynthesis C-methylase UbiE